jgi:hypothetical protein
MKVILAAPRIPDDKATEMTEQWAIQIKNWINTLNLNLISFIGQDATRANVESALIDDFDNKGIFIFIDHGDKNILFDAQEKPLIDFYNIGLLKNKFIYAVACRSASELGHKSLEEGAAGYIGFNHYFKFISTYSDTFGKCFLHGLTTLLRERKSALEARKTIVSLTERIINEIKKNKKISQIDKSLTTTCLRHNMDYMVLLGNTSWTID